MASLDKSLDDIISSKKPRKFTKSVKAGKAGKPVRNSKNLISKKPKAKVTAEIKQRVLDATYATKVVVYGLPKDIHLDAIKDFFQSQVGSVQNIALSYNEKGQFKGIATIIFKNNKAAAKAVEKYNGAPIDGGSSKLKLELIVDPTKKPLASRIGSSKPVSLASRIKPANVAALNGKGPKPKGPNTKGPKGPKPAPKKPAPKKAPKKEKKTIEQLDQEMADYFESNE